jgi:malate permease and related proteins
MLDVVNTIVPVFLVILLGYFLHAKELLPAPIVGPLNRLVFYLAIPAMIFREISRVSFSAYFSASMLVGTLAPILMVFLLGLVVLRLLKIPAPFAGTFLQSSQHGNLGYIGLAVAYYLLGADGLTAASILAGFMMLLQNFLSVLGLEIFYQGPERKHKTWFLIKKVVGNPVVLSALAGILFSVLRIPLPIIADRGLKIISDMSLPLALLIIGGSLSFGLIRSHLKLAVGAGILKLLFLPALGLLLCEGLRVPTAQFLPGLILLGSPTATVTYVMASEMQGSTDLASAAVTMNTLASCLTFIFWLSFFVQ